MSITLPHTRRVVREGRPARAGAATGIPGQRRVRHEVRDGMAGVAFSATVSSVLAVVLTLLLAWTR